MGEEQFSKNKDTKMQTEKYTLFGNEVGPIVCTSLIAEQCELFSVIKKVEKILKNGDILTLCSINCYLKSSFPTQAM